MDSLLSIATKIATPMSLAALSIIILSTIFIAIVRRGSGGQNRKLLEKISLYTFLIGAVLGVGGLASYSATAIIPYFMEVEIRVSGVVIDNSNGDEVPFAVVRIVGEPATESDRNGNFELIVPKSRFRNGYTVFISDEEYESQSIEVLKDFSKPIIVKLEKKPLTSEVFDSIKKLFVSHWLGMPTVNIEYRLHNKNPSRIRISEVLLYLESPKGEKMALNPITTYYVIPPSSFVNNVVRIDSGQEVTINTEYLFQNSNYYDIQSKIMARSPAVQPIPPVSAPIFDDDFSSDIKKFARNEFRWTVGVWKLHISVRSSNGQDEKNIEFNIRNTDIKVLNDVINDYNYGYGIFPNLRFSGPNRGFVEIVSN